MDFAEQMDSGCGESSSQRRRFKNNKPEEGAEIEIHINVQSLELLNTMSSERWFFSEKKPACNLSKRKKEK